MPLNTKTARVIDPVLTEIAQGYVHAQRVGHVLFPRVEVLQRGGQVIEFGRESFVDYRTKRAPGASTMRIQFGYEGKPYSLAQFALDVPCPREFLEEAQQVPGIDMGRRATVTGMESLSLTLEIEQAKLATDAANYADANKRDLATETQWSDPASDPIADIDAAKDHLRTTCGIEPNRMVIQNKGCRALKNHPKIIERFKYTSSDSISAKMLANLLDLEELAVAKATYVSQDDPDGNFKEAWGNSAVLAYVPSQDMAMEQPSFGYTYTLKGHPFVEEPRWDGDTRSWVYGVTFDRAPVLTGIASGFLFSNITN